jgi:hypothetical protein
MEWTTSNVIENASSVEKQLGSFAGIDTFSDEVVQYEQQKNSSTANAFLVLQFTNESGEKFRMMASTFLKKAATIPGLLQHDKSKNTTTINKTMWIKVSSSKNSVTIAPVAEKEAKAAK